MGSKDNIVPGSNQLLPKAYDDVVHPSAEVVGEIISYIPRTIRLGLGKWQKWLVNGEESLNRTFEALRDKADKIPEERQCEPEPNIVVPAVSQISYCYDSDVLREMYANLLATSMDELEKSHVHPSFVGIIQQLTPDEAKLLKVLPQDTVTLVPVIDLRRVDESADGFTTVFRNLCLLGEGVCEHPENGPAYLENLARLKLIEIPEDMHLTDDSRYAPLMNTQIVNVYRQNCGPNSRIVFHKKVLYLSNYGLEFVRCCIDEYDPNKYSI